MKTLLAITTYNQLKYTKICLDSINTANLPNVDIVFVDDVSTDGTQRYLLKNNMHLLERYKPKGLTYSWNLAYRLFKEESYDCLILANNDVIISEKSVMNLISSTVDKQLVCPMTTLAGVQHNPFQDVKKHYPNIQIDIDCYNYEDIDKQLNPGVLPMNKFNGFFFAMSKKIILSECDTNNLFNPTNVNIGQEADLQRRLTESPYLCLNSFIYHYKNASFSEVNKKYINQDVRNNLTLFH